MKKIEVAVATGAGASSFDESATIVAALSDIGISADSRSWSDPAVDWSDYRIVIIHSTWDYAANIEAFRSWVGRVPGLLNTASVVHWNLSKNYLISLRSIGVPIVPTTWVRRCSRAVPLIPAGSFVVKPAVGNCARGVMVFGPREHQLAFEHIGRMRRSGRDALIQPYLPSFDNEGETDVVVIAGKISHAVRKRAGLRDTSAAAGQVMICDVSDAQRRVVRSALNAVPGGPGQLLYARVDLANGPIGEPLVAELELIEPSLFMSFSDAAAHLLAEGVARRMPSASTARER
jgi:hypothetical protein